MTQMLCLFFHSGKRNSEGLPKIVLRCDLSVTWSTGKTFQPLKWTPQLWLKRAQRARRNKAALRREDNALDKRRGNFLAEAKLRGPQRARSRPPSWSPRMLSSARTCTAPSPGDFSRVLVEPDNLYRRI